jgi:pimeloyl-ACP methyl ester carboxylesterase
VRRLLPGALALALSAAGCRVVRLDEVDVFAPRRLVTPRLVDSLRATRRELRLPVADGVELAVWHLTHPGSRATVVHFGGNASLMATSTGLVRALLSLPVDVVMVDPRGYGESDGRPTVAALLSDAGRVLDHVVTALGVPLDRVVLHGHSLGTFPALALAAERQVGAVVLEAPVTSVADLTDRLVPWIAEPFVDFELAPVLLAEDNLPRVARLDEPVLLLVGSEDRVTPPAMATALHDAAPRSVDRRLVVLPGAGHDDLAEHPRFVEAYRELLLRRGLLAPLPAGR